MANKKATELVSFAEKALKEKWGYVWGGAGEVYTKAVAERLYKIFGSKTSKYNENYYTEKQMKLWGGKKVVDCSGLIQAFRGTDDTANGLYNKCVSKGKFVKTTIYPTGYLVFCQGSNGSMNHVGVVVSDGYVIHATNSEIGVIKEKLATSTRGWTHWGKASFIDYDAAPTLATSQPASLTRPTLRKGDKGDDVKFLQERLNKKFKAGLVVDGSFGSATDAAVREFQRAKGLVVDGIAGAKSWAALT